VRKEAVLSSQIEGTQSSLSDLLLHEHKAAPGVLVDDVEEVSNYVAAMNHGVARLDKLPLSVRLIRELHGKLVRGTRGATVAGELRRVQVWIGGTNPETARFVPPPAHEVPEALGALERFVHRPGVPALIKAGLVHAQFETIHPFLDGNGRVGRMLIPLLLISEGVLERPWLYMSLHFKRHRSAYYDALQAVRIEGAWERWLGFFLGGVTEVATGAVSKIHEILQLFESDRERVARSRGGSTYQQAAQRSNLQVFEHLRRRVMTTIPEISKATEISKPVVARALGDLEALKIARELTGKKRDRVYVYDRYIEILNRDR
jgi:Fic family protein